MRNGKKFNVAMIADDDRLIRKIIASALQDIAHVVEVEDGAAVQASYEAHMPDILFLDIHLPNVSGLELIQRLYGSDENAHIVMISADSSRSNVLQAAECGVKGFLTKPFDKQRIINLFNDCPTIKFSDTQSQ